MNNDDLTAESERDLVLSRRALELASRGAGLVSPNPLVGCVLVSATGEVVGEGTYIYDDVVHAEAVALEQAGEKARGGTAYVSLEPHSHQGKTQPCTEALIDAGIKRVVSPIQDPNPLVSGRGFQRLSEADLDVVTGILAEEASRQNEKFICWHKKHRPFVHLKMAVSLDGRISLGPEIASRISSDQALKRVHELRHAYDAILVGANTVALDDPQLTDRSGLPRRRPLVRVVLDSDGKTPAKAVLFATASEIPTIVFTNTSDENWSAVLSENGVEIVSSESGARDLPSVLEELKARDIQSVLVEGGSEVAASFIRGGLVDKVTFIYSPLIVGSNDAPFAVGGEAIEMPLRLRGIEVDRLGDDIEVTGYPDGSS